MTDTHKIIEVIYRSVAEYYGIEWKMALQVTSYVGRREYYNAKALATYMIRKTFGIEDTINLLGITYSQINNACFKVNSSIGYNKPLQGIISEIKTKINAVR
jgi:hypothetical protein